MKSRALPIAFCLCLVATVAGGVVAGAAEPAANNADTLEHPTWSDNIAAILFENCASCHRPGQVAPMSLLSYKEARPWAKSIRRVVEEKRYGFKGRLVWKPWVSQDDCLTEYESWRRSLSDALGKDAVEPIK